MCGGERGSQIHSQPLCEVSTYVATKANQVGHVCNATAHSQDCQWRTCEYSKLYVLYQQWSAGLVPLPTIRVYHLRIGWEARVVLKQVMQTGGINVYNV